MLLGFAFGTFEPLGGLVTHDVRNLAPHVKLADAIGAVIVAEFTRATFVAVTPPIFTVEPAVKPVPVMVTDIPPRLSPDAGATDDTVTEGV